MPDPRRPQSVYSQGSEPDARFSMANERTALAWVRTALGLVAGGVGLTGVAQVADLHGAVHIAAVVLCLAGGLLAVSAVAGWQRREIALRTNSALPAPVALPWLAAAVVIVAVVIAILALLA